jgi:hypothetical protein
MILEKAEIAGSGKGPTGWFDLREVAVSYDHSLHLKEDIGVNIDFVNPKEGLSSRVAVELTAQSARELVRAILAALERGKEVVPH